jgi:hypothetical protein
MKFSLATQVNCGDSEWEEVAKSGEFWRANQLSHLKTVFMVRQRVRKYESFARYP